MNTILELKLTPPILPLPAVMSPTQWTSATDRDVTNMQVSTTDIDVTNTADQSK